MYRKIPAPQSEMQVSSTLDLDIYTVYLTRGISLTGDYDFGEDYPIRVTEFVPLLE